VSSATFALAPAARAAVELEHAQKLAAGGIASSARVAGTRALMLLAEALGLDESARALVQVLVTAAEGHGALTDYDVAHLRGEVEVEGKDGVRRILPLDEIKKLIRGRDSSWRLP
jgi:hypothetical protein